MKKKNIKLKNSDSPVNTFPTTSIEPIIIFGRNLFTRNCKTNDGLPALIVDVNTVTGSVCLVVAVVVGRFSKGWSVVNYLPKEKRYIVFFLNVIKFYCIITRRSFRANQLNVINYYPIVSNNYFIHPALSLRVIIYNVRNRLTSSFAFFLLFQL